MDKKEYSLLLVFLEIYLHTGLFGSKGTIPFLKGKIVNLVEAISQAKYLTSIYEKAYVSKLKGRVHSLSNTFLPSSCSRGKCHYHCLEKEKPIGHGVTVIIKSGKGLDQFIVCKTIGTQIR